MLKFSAQSALLADEFGLPPGVALYEISQNAAVANDWLAWFPSDVLLGTEQATAGILTARHIPEAQMEMVEKHNQPELFIMVGGEGTTLLPRGEGWALLRLKEKSVLRIEKGIPHYFGPSLSPQVLCVVVNCPESVTEYQQVV